MSKLIKIIINQHRKDSGIEIDADGTSATGIARAIISHQEDGIVTWGFGLSLGFIASIFNGEDDSPKVVISRLEVTRAYTWQEYVSNNDEYVMYVLSDAERDIIIPQLEAYVLAYVANSTILGDSGISDGGLFYEGEVQHMSLDFNSQDCFFADGDEYFYGLARGLLDEKIEFTVSFEGDYSEAYQQAEYHGGVLVEPKTAKIKNIEVQDLVYKGFMNVDGGELLHDYELSEEDKNIINHIIRHEVKLRHTQRLFPLGESNQISA